LSTTCRAVPSSTANGMGLFVGEDSSKRPRTSVFRAAVFSLRDGAQHREPRHKRTQIRPYDGQPIYTRPGPVLAFDDFRPNLRTRTRMGVNKSMPNPSEIWTVLYVQQSHVTSLPMHERSVSVWTGSASVAPNRTVGASFCTSANNDGKICDRPDIPSTFFHCQCEASVCRCVARYPAWPAQPPATPTANIA
ncbi:hypothetical protein AAVH_32252, partial [Aphelenchoides avenae]